MISGPFRIVLIFPNKAEPHYFWRDEEVKGPYGPKMRPLFSPNPGDARRFQTEASVVAFRDHFRSLCPFKIYVETLTGLGPLFEREAEPTPDEDHRTPMWVIPDGEEQTMLGFMAVPAWSATLGGRCWAVRSRDVPAIVAAGRDSALESAYGATALEAVERAIQLWGPALMVPFAHSQIEAQAGEEIRQLVTEIKNHRNAPGRPRPGDF